MEKNVVIKLLQTMEKGHAPIEHIFTGHHHYNEEIDVHVYWYFDEHQKKQEMIISFREGEAVVKIIGSAHSSYIPLKMNELMRGRYIMERHLLEFDFLLKKLIKMQENIEIEYDVMQNKKVISRNKLTIEVITDGD